MMKRGVGFCHNTPCDDFAKGIFLLNHEGDLFRCPRCFTSGIIEEERGHWTGDSNIFREVRVEFDFDPLKKKYLQIAIVQDNSLPAHFNIYTLHSPLIKTEQRALKVAEVLLGNLNRYRCVPGEIPSALESVLSFDEPISVFSAKLEQLARVWEKSGLAKTGVDNAV